MSSFVVAHHPFALHQMMLWLVEKHVPLATTSFVGHHMHFFVMFVTYVSTALGLQIGHPYTFSPHI
jgi:hypothetical protein